MDLSLTVKGKKVQQLATRAPRLLQIALDDGLKKAAYLIEREAKIATPVDTGRLRASIYTTFNFTQATIQPKTKYAVWIHEGVQVIGGKTYRIRGGGKARTPAGGKPYMEIAIKKAEASINRLLRDNVNRQLKRLK